MGLYIFFAFLGLKLSSSPVLGHTLNILDFGAIADDISANLTNRAALSAALSKAAPGDTGWDHDV